ncbi:superoxide dismutase [Cu-Zn] [Ptiloglossa arizonensis]|uniref:superoxide dismutase [Cu-Zn] n=1 Tax=Ptiloglossa arizonensis TaxID=3350558 RepID=UPI003FA07F8D
MMNRFVILLLSVAGTVITKEICGTVHLMPHDENTANVTGHLTITQNVENGPVKIVGHVHGLTPGLHGFHVHQKGTLEQGCTSTGAHFNPTEKVHGGPQSSERHVGDLGNIEADAHGNAVVDITDTIISLSGPNNILGRAFVVHSGEDDLGKGQSSLSLTTGNSGDRVACGIIGVLKG